MSFLTFPCGRHCDKHFILCMFISGLLGGSSLNMSQHAVASGYPLGLWDVHVMCFDPPSSLSFSQIHSVPSHPTLCLFSCPIKANLCCSNILGCVAFHRGVVDFPGDTLSENTDPSPPSSQQLPTDLWIGAELHAQLPSPCLGLVWLGLAQV